MRNGNACRRVGAFVGAAAIAGQLIVRIAWRTGHGSCSVAIAVVLVALPVSAQVVQDTTNVIGMLITLILVVGGPALVGVGADWAVRLCISVRDASMPYRASSQFILARWAGQITKFPKANITTIAVPLIDECKPKGGKIRLIGGDGSYFTGEKQEELRRAMKKWIVDYDMDIQYLLVQPAPGVPEAMKAFSKEALGDKGDKLSVFVRDDSVEMPADVQHLADFLATYHPNLISWPSGEDTARALWLEGRHPPHEDVSYDNRWVPPGSMSDPVSRHAGPTMTWNDVFLRWERAFDELSQCMVAR